MSKVHVFDFPRAPNPQQQRVVLLNLGVHAQAQKGSPENSPPPTQNQSPRNAAERTQVRRASAANSFQSMRFVRHQRPPRKPFLLKASPFPLPLGH